jgi:hypothetical protein
VEQPGPKKKDINELAIPAKQEPKPSKTSDSKN